MRHPAREEVWRLHAEGRTVREIADATGVHRSSVQRIISAGRDHHQEAETERRRDAGVLDMAQQLQQNLLTELEESRQEAQEAKTAGEWRNIPAERKVRVSVVQELARLLGVGHEAQLKREAMELRRRQLAGTDSLRDTLEKALGLDQAEEEPSAQEDPIGPP